MSPTFQTHFDNDFMSEAQLGRSPAIISAISEEDTSTNDSSTQLALDNVSFYEADMEKWLEINELGLAECRARQAMEVAECRHRQEIQNLLSRVHEYHIADSSSSINL